MFEDCCLCLSILCPLPKADSEASICAKEKQRRAAQIFPFCSALPLFFSLYTWLCCSRETKLCSLCCQSAPCAKGEQELSFVYLHPLHSRIRSATPPVSYAYWFHIWVWFISMFLNIPKWRSILPFREACTWAGFVNKNREPQLRRILDAAGAAQPNCSAGLPVPRDFACTPMDCLHVPLQPSGALYPLARLCSAFVGWRVPLCVVQGLQTPNPEAGCWERLSAKIYTWAGWQPKLLGINVTPSKACPEVLAAVSPARATGWQ